MGASDFGQTLPVRLSHLNAKTETETIEAALERIIFEEEAWKAFQALQGQAKHFDFSRLRG